MQTGQSFSSLFNGDFPDDDIRTLNVASNIDGFTNEQEWSLASVLGRVNYNLRDTYIFTATFRADGSSRFGDANRWGGLLNDEIITDQFSDFSAYKKFLQESSAKDDFDSPAI
jgi:hypothetical protein